MGKPFVLSLGGSLIVPDEIDIDFLKKFRQLITKQTKKGRRFIIITGGGKLCRKYQSALSQISKADDVNLDWMGINVTWLNAKLVQLMFGENDYPGISRDPTKKINFSQKILVGGGWKPGRSSDGATIKYAMTYDAKTVINLSNVDFVYDKDPRKFKDAKKITNISWKEFIKIVGGKWDPGKNVPFDPTAAKLAQKNKIKVIICNGKNLKNLENILNGKKFKGTIIS